ncbi:MAG: hypothetical protein DBX55_06860 [Verrucomicrobia bacterium]|nr:MAG: hypothetical protein DBX55_06860 [Verrucomicrobiota bacterium]
MSAFGLLHVRAFDSCVFWFVRFVQILANSIRECCSRTKPIGFFRPFNRLEMKNFAGTIRQILDRNMYLLSSG